MNRALAIENVLERLGGDEELLAEVVELFIDEVPDILCSLEEAIKNGDWENARKLAHTLKGSSSNIGAERFASLALELEKTSKDQDSSRAVEAFQLLKDEFSAVEEFVNNPGWIKLR